MSPAWMRRNSERQRILEMTQMEIIHLDDEDSDWLANRYQACAYLGQVIIGYLFKENATLSSLQLADPPYQLAARKLFYDKILPRYKEFSRIEEEKDSTLSELAEWLICKQAMVLFHQNLRYRELFDSNTVFSALSATSDVT